MKIQRHKVVGFYASLIAYLEEERRVLPSRVGSSMASSMASAVSARMPNLPSNPGVNWRMLALSSTIFAVLAVAVVVNDLLNSPFQQQWIMDHASSSLVAGGVFGVWLVMIFVSVSRGKLMIGSHGKRALTKRPEARKERDDEDENF